MESCENVRERLLVILNSVQFVRASDKVEVEIGLLHALFSELVSKERVRGKLCSLKRFIACGEYGEHIRCADGEFVRFSDLEKIIKDLE